MKKYITKIDGVMYRVPKKHAGFFCYAVPLPQKAKIFDNKFISKDEVRQRQAAGEILDNRFFPSSCTRTSKLANSLGMAENRKIKQRHKGVFNMINCLCTVTCKEYDKPRVVFSSGVIRTSEEREELKKIEIECNMKPYVCVYKLITQQSISIHDRVQGRRLPAVLIFKTSIFSAWF